ncbi:IS3 family transposase, partial [Paenibacillus sp. LHD-117]|uniref:IS3 family transposase n=1 Tax=Paenibacillus sp. LHD-117 TaxID=3071412 RepID=UPI0027E0CBC6
MQKKAVVGRPVPGQSMTQEGRPVSDEQISEWLSEAVSSDEEVVYGYRKLTVFLRRTYLLVINKKKVYRLLKAMDLLHPQRRKNVSFPRKLASNRTLTASNELWEMDIKYG